MLAVNSALGVSRTRELIDVIRRDPGKYAFGSIGAGSLSHLAMVGIALESGARGIVTSRARVAAALSSANVRRNAQNVADANVSLHVLGTREAVVRLDRRPGHARARALLRDTRWEVTGAGPVPLVGQPDLAKTVAFLLWLRLRRAVRVAGGRWMGATAGGALTGLLAATLGGLLLCLGPGSRASPSVPVVLGLIGLTVGGLGAAGVGAGLAAAEVLFRSRRGPALVLFGAAGGSAVGAGAHLLAFWTIQGLFGRDLSAVASIFQLDCSTDPVGRIPVFT